MAYTKKGASSAKPVHTAELTTGQLVLAVCTFLIVLLGVFLLGIIVGEYQYKMREARAVDVAGTSEVPAGEGRQPGSYAAVKRDAQASKPPAREPEPFRSNAGAPSTAVVVAAPSPSASPAPVAKAPLPPVTSTAPEPPKTEAPLADAGRASTAVPLEPLGSSDEPSKAPDEGDANTADDAGTIDLLPDEPDTAAAAASAPANEPKPGQRVYSVQVAALSEPKNADAIKKKLESTTSWPVDITLNSNKKLHLVLVGRFATEGEAAKAQAELQKTPEFAKAFISSRVLE